MSTSTPDTTSDVSVFQPLPLFPVWCDLQTPFDDAMPESDHDSVIPAQLSYLAIYNPTLGPTDETIADQIVFYTSKSSYARRIDSSTVEGETNKSLEDEENERLRQIGLAQGMVNFARLVSPQTPQMNQSNRACSAATSRLERHWSMLKQTKHGPFCLSWRRTGGLLP